MCLPRTRERVGQGVGGIGAGARAHATDSHHSRGTTGTWQRARTMRMGLAYSTVDPRADPAEEAAPGYAASSELKTTETSFETPRCSMVTP